MPPFIPPSQHELTSEQRRQLHTASLITIALVLVIMIVVLWSVQFFSTHEIIQKSSMVECINIIQT